MQIWYYYVALHYIPTYIMQGLWNTDLVLAIVSRFEINTVFSSFCQQNLFGVTGSNEMQK